MARLRYVLAHGVKEGLVSDLCSWPGAHAVHALLLEAAGAVALERCGAILDERTAASE